MDSDIVEKCLEIVSSADSAPLLSILRLALPSAPIKVKYGERAQLVQVERNGSNY